ncbi:hypothetical protein GCM10025762_12170 [Haloechinothrix salitolerans]
MRGANAATGFVLSSLLVCGVIVVSDIGTYALPTTNQGSPLAEGSEPDAPTGPAVDVARPSTSQSITVPVKLGSPREAHSRGGAAVALPAAATSRPNQRQRTDRRGDPRPGQGSFTTGASHDRPDGSRGTPSRRGATSDGDGRDAAETRDAAPDRGGRTFRSSGSGAAPGR